jgi:predicted TIM-barrel fold metal-dependent hydrolase
MSTITVNPPNLWRLETPGHGGWPRTARPGDPRKYFVVSADTHVNEPSTLWLERMDKRYHERLPRVVTDANGVQWRVCEGYRPDRLRLSDLEGEDLVRSKAGADPAERLRDMDQDGVDAQVLFPNKGLAMWATPDSAFAMAQCRAYNDWVWEVFGPHVDRMSPAAALATGDLEGSIAEIERVAALGFRVLTLPCKPIWGAHDVEHPNYNLPHFDRLWAAIQDVDLPITFHVSTGRDPRAARGNGGAVINYVSHSLSPTIEPVANLCASGVLERFPRLRFATIEAGIGWLPWLLTAMDEAYRKHHFWVRPKLACLPSEHFRAHGFASFQEDAPGLDLAERYALMPCLMWGNDYPHHEGTWPHSPEAIERTMGGLTDRQRAQVLGLNAARFFGFRVPEPTSGE